MDIQHIKDNISLPSLEGMTKTKSLLLITGTILYVDCVLNLFYKKNIQSFWWSNFFNSENIFQIIVILFVYSALFTFLLPALNLIITSIITNIKFNSKASKKSDFNCRVHVSLYKIKIYSEIENNSVLHKEYEKVEESKFYSENMSKISFCAVFLIVLNLILGDSANKTILHYLLTSDILLENLIRAAVEKSALSVVIVFIVSRIFYLFIFLLILYFPTIWWISTFNEDVEWVYNPDLAKIINKDVIEKQSKHNSYF